MVFPYLNTDRLSCCPLVLWKKMAQNWYFIGLTLIIAGALGNFIDRIRQDLLLICSKLNLLIFQFLILRISYYLLVLFFFSLQF